MGGIVSNQISMENIIQPFHVCVHQGVSVAVAAVFQCLLSVSPFPWPESILMG
jgi:hypothetical protein